MGDYEMDGIDWQLWKVYNYAFGHVFFRIDFEEWFLKCSWNYQIKDCIFFITGNFGRWNTATLFFLRLWNSTCESRQGNEATHILARHPHNIEDTLKWWNSCPDVISNQVLLDASTLFFRLSRFGFRWFAINILFIFIFFLFFFMQYERSILVIYTCIYIYRYI